MLRAYLFLGSLKAYGVNLPLAGELVPISNTLGIFDYLQSPLLHVGSARKSRRHSTIHFTPFAIRLVFHEWMSCQLVPVSLSLDRKYPKYPNCSTVPQPFSTTAINNSTAAPAPTCSVFSASPWLETLAGHTLRWRFEKNPRSNLARLGHGTLGSKNGSSHWKCCFLLDLWCPCEDKTQKSNKIQ